MEIAKFNVLTALTILVASWICLTNPAYGDNYNKVWDSGNTIPNPVFDVAVGDLDGDGKLEIIISDAPPSGGAKVYVFENTGDNSYQKVWDSGTTLTMLRCWIAIGDQDDDGKLEIIALENKDISPFSGKLHVFENNGDNTYQEVWNSGSAFANLDVGQLFLGDADNDGKREIIFKTGTNVSHEIRVYENTGDNAYQEVWNSGSTLSDDIPEGAVGDTDGDGKMEIVVGSGDLDSQVHVFENTGDDSYQLVSSLGTFNWDIYAAIGDQDGDGKAEIIAGGHERVVHIFENTGDNTYIDVWNSGTMSGRTSLVATGDQDSDGNREIIVPCGDGKVYLFENTGDNTYDEVWNSGSAMSAGVYRVATGDQDGDGKGEIIAACYDGKVYVFECTGSCGKVVIAVDIKPQSCPNPLNTKSKGVLPVAVLGSVDLNVNDIDVSTVELEGVSPLRSDIEDVSTPIANQQDECDCTTDGADGFGDLTLKFDTQAIVAVLGNVNDGDEVPLTLTGKLHDGTDVEGKDCVVVKSRGGKGRGKTASEAEKRSPTGYALYQNNPNPFNPETEIRFRIPETSHINVKIFNVLGEEVRTLEDALYEVGYHSIRWDGKDNNGHAVSSGIYFYQLQVDTFFQMRKMSLVR